MQKLSDDPAAIDLDKVREVHFRSGPSEGSLDTLPLIAAVEALREKLIWGFYEEEAPEYQQGGSPHELHELVTAENCTGLVNTIKELRAREVEMKAMKQFISDFEAQFVCWGMMSMTEENDAVKHFLERATTLTKLDTFDKEKPENANG